MADRIRFYLDEQVPKAVAEGLRSRGVDVLRAQEAGLLSAGDRAHLDRAATEGRVVFTQDVDFLRLHSAGASHCGIVYAPQHTPIGRMVRGLMLVYDVLSPADMVGHVELV